MNDTNELTDIIAVGSGNPVVIDDCGGLDPYRPELARLADAGLIEMQTAAAGGILVMLTEAGRLASGLQPSQVAVQPEPVQRRFCNTKDATWVGYVHDFRRQHGRAPTVHEVRRQFPAMSRATAYRYIQLGKWPSLRLVSVA